MQKYKSLVTDIFLADKANIAGFMFKLNGYTSDGAPYGIMQSQDSTNGQPNLRMDTKTGEILCQKANITGTIIATKGTINYKFFYLTFVNDFFIVFHPILFKNAESYTFNFILALSISFILHEKNSKNKSKRYNE